MRTILDRLAILLVVTVILAAGLAGCEEAEKARPVFTSQVVLTTPDSPRSQGLVFAVASESEPEDTYLAYRPLVEYLSARTGLAIKLSVSKSNAGVQKMLKDGDAHLARLSAGGYVSYLPAGELEILAKESSAGSNCFQAVIIVRQNSPCGSFEHLKGKSFALVDQVSISGYSYPVWLAADRGQSLEEYFSELDYTGSHSMSIMAVYDGIADGACVASYVLESEIRSNPWLSDSIKVIARSPELTRGPIVAGPGLKAEWRELIRDALLAMGSSQQGRMVLQGLGLDGFSPGREGDYDANREFARPINQQEGWRQPYEN